MKKILLVCLAMLLPPPVATADSVSSGMSGSQRSEPEKAQATEQTVRVLSWNVLAPSPWQRLLHSVGMATESAHRTTALLDAIAVLNPDIIALQEVTAAFQAALASDHRFAKFHRAASPHQSPPGGLLILSRFALSAVDYRRLPGRSGRYVLYARVAIGGQQFVIANVHLASPLQAGDQRRAQMMAVNRWMPAGALRIWVGDFNFGDADNEQDSMLLTDWVDAWKQLKPDAPGLSYDLGRNHLAKQHAFSKETSRRLDRILLSPALHPLAITLTGQTMTDLPPSDHYGLLLDFKLPQ